MKVLVSQFASMLSEHGGVHRHQQLKKLLMQKGKVHTVTFEHNFRKILSFAILHPYIFIRITFMILRFGYHYRMPFIRIAKALASCTPALIELFQKRYSEVEIIHCETSSDFSLLFCILLRQLKKAYYSYPHNVEALVPNEHANKMALCKYALERDCYKWAVEVHCISKLDQYLVRMLGGNASLLPYHSPRHVYDYYKDIGLEREKTAFKRNHVLILGSVKNAPSKSGMTRLLDSISQQTDKRHSYIVCGFGTECLVEYESASIQVRGTVSNSELRKLLIHAKCILINQAPTTGILTRVINLSHAEIPVLINDDYLQGSEFCGDLIKLYSENQLCSIDSSISELS